MHREIDGHPQDGFVMFMMRENENIHSGGSLLCVLALVPPQSTTDAKKLFTRETS
jgi:hypothetical protein